DEGYGRRIRLVEFCEMGVVDCAARRAWLDGVEQEIFAGGEVCPDAFSLRRRHTDRSGAADASMITADHRKYLDATNIAIPKHTIRPTNIREDASPPPRPQHPF